MTSLTPTGDTAPDPAEIDLEGLKALMPRKDIWSTTEVKPLISAVEALRDLVGGLNIDLVNAGHDNEALRERVAELTEPHDGPCYYCGRATSGLAGDPSEWPLMFCHKEDPGRSKHHHVGCVTKKLRSAETSEAHAVELVGALEVLYGSSTNETRERARTALKATPPEALERSRARDEVVRLTRCCHAGWADASGQLGKALSALDALQGEDEI